MAPGGAPIIVDFAPHTVHYAGQWGGHWYVSLLQAPLLLELNDAGMVTRRIPVANVVLVKDGVAVATTQPRVRQVNVKREAPANLAETIGWDLAATEPCELWRRPDDGEQLLVRGSDPRVEPVPGGLRLGERVYSFVENVCGGARWRWDWNETFADGDVAVVIGNMRVLRIPLASDPGDHLRACVVPAAVGDLPLEPATVFFVGDERLLVDHPSRGRFWFDIANTGLAKADPVAIGGFVSLGLLERPYTGNPGIFFVASTVATVLAHGGNVLQRGPVPVAAGAGELLVGTPFVADLAEEEAPPQAFVDVLEVLAAAGFVDPVPPGEVAERWREIGAVDAASVLAAIHPGGSGAARGVIVHDHRFLNETDDVVAELAAALEGEPIAFVQEGVRADALRIRAGERVEWVHFVPDGLDAIVRWMNRRLEEAGAKRRIHALETGGDDGCWVVCEPERFARL